jgi:D-alanyl-D-alanine dipeptidase
MPTLRARMFFPRKKAGLCALAIFLPLIAPAQPPDIPEIPRAAPRKVVWSQRGETMVDISQACPGICIELRYATERNFTGKLVYPVHARALIRKSVAARLRKVQDALRKEGYGLKIWDAYRPAWAQDILWKAAPNPEYLAAPSRGGSYHTWGASVDVTLVDLQGREQPMASDFDDFSLAAKSEYVGADPVILARMITLRSAMKNAGFGGIRDEWWHFTAEDAGYFAPVDMPLEKGGKY